MILNLVHASAAPQITELCSEREFPLFYINRQPDSLEMERWEQEGIRPLILAQMQGSPVFFRERKLRQQRIRGDINGDGEVSYIMIQGARKI